MLPAHLPAAFRSLVPLHQPNPDVSFFTAVSSPQHKLRLNGLALLRRECSHVAVRDLLRVVVPYLVAQLRDIAQGRRMNQHGVAPEEDGGIASPTSLPSPPTRPPPPPPVPRPTSPASASP